MVYQHQLRSQQILVPDVPDFQLDHAAPGNGCRGSLN
jgi:hypothetical protein